jgi:phosphoribosylformylglycinamidine (FGAM) synthase PurS component
MTGWNLPPGCTDRMIDEAFGYSSGRRGVYTVTIVKTIELVLEVEASSSADAEDDAKNMADATPLKDWTVSDEDVSVQDPPERDPDEERNARIDWKMDRDR